MKNYLKIGLLVFIFLPLSPAIAGEYTSHFTLTKGALTLALTATCATYWWLRTPAQVDASLKNLNILTFIPSLTSKHPTRSIEAVCTAVNKGENHQNQDSTIQINNQIFDLSCQIPSNCQKIFIYVSGYSGVSGNARYKYAGTGAAATYKNYLNNIIKDAPCISFDGPVNYRSTFNFGQKSDQDCLNTIYEETVKQNPEAEIILVGTCKGATTILNYLTHPENKAKLNNVKAVILESPSLSLEALTDHVAKNNVHKNLQWLLPYLFKAVFPNYTWNQPTVLDKSENIPSHISILIGSLVHDKVASHKDICTLLSTLKNSRKKAELVESSDKTLKHARLIESKEYQEKVNTFLKSL